MFYIADRRILFKVAVDSPDTQDYSRGRLVKIHMFIVVADL